MKEQPTGTRKYVATKCNAMYDCDGHKKVRCHEMQCHVRLYRECYFTSHYLTNKRADHCLQHRFKICLDMREQPVTV